MSITPGPWKALRDASGYFIAPQASHGETVPVIASLEGPPELCEANARLIATAPEMMELLKDIRYDYFFGVILKIKDLLQKVEGEEKSA